MKYPRPQGLTPLQKVAKKPIPPTPAESAMAAQTGHGDTPGPNPQTISSWAKTVSNHRTNARLTKELLPDYKLAQVIQVSSILSPTDMINCDLTLVLECDKLGEVSAKLLEVLRTFWMDVYKIKELPQVILNEALYESGSYPMVVIPPSAIDEILNGSAPVTTESLSKCFNTATSEPLPLGLLGYGNAQKPTMESLAQAFVPPSARGFSYRTHTAQDDLFDQYFKVYDNPDVLKRVALEDFVSNQRKGAAYGAYRTTALAGENKTTNIGLMAGARTLSLGLANGISGGRDFTVKTIQRIKSPDELNDLGVGHPFEVTPYPESFILVTHPSDPKKIEGAFLVHDQNGNPLRIVETQDYFSEFGQQREYLQTISTQLQANLAKGQAPTTNITQDGGATTLDDMSMLFNHLMTARLKKLCENGSLGANVDISLNNSILQVMLSRMLSKQQTQMIFIPADYFTYFAFDVDDRGRGRSLLEQIELHTNMRAVAKFANNMAMLKNAVSHKVVEIQLDEKDPAPAKTVEFLQFEHARMRGRAWPLGTMVPLDIVNHLQAAGTEFIVKGHPGYPETSMSTSERQTSHPTVDNDFSDQQRRESYMGLGLSPEIIELSGNADFQISALNQHILHAKVAIERQRQLTAMLKDYSIKYANCSPYLQEKLYAVINDNMEYIEGRLKKKYAPDVILSYALSKMEFVLPEPDTSQIALQAKAMEEYSGYIEKALDAHMSGEAFTSNEAGDASNNVGQIKATLKNRLLRDWMARNDVAPEVGQLFDDLGAVLQEEHERYKQVVPMIVSYSAKNLTIAKAATDALQNANGGEGFEQGASADGGGSSEGSGSTEFDEGGGSGGGDFSDLGVDGGAGDPVSADTDTEDPEGTDTGSDTETTQDEDSKPT